MKLDIYAKHRTGSRKDANGKTVPYDFYSYTTQLVRKNGDLVTVAVRFRDDSAPDGKECPCSIIVDRKDINLSKRSYTVEIKDDDGNVIDEEEREGQTLWVKKYELAEFVDHSLDDFDLEASDADYGESND